VAGPVAPTDAQGRSVIAATSTTVGGHVVHVEVLRDGQWRAVTFIPAPDAPVPPNFRSSPVTLTFTHDCIPGVAPDCEPKTQVDNEHRSRIVVDPDYQKADGVSRDVANIYVFDAMGHPVEGAVVTSSSSQADVTIQPSDTIQPTDAAGRTTIWYSTTKDGSREFRVRASFQSASGDVLFVPQPGSSPSSSYQSSPFDLHFVDGQTPAAPVITEPAEGAHVSDNRPVIRGGGQPGATVTVQDGDKELGRVTVEADGSWSLRVPEPLGEGPHVISASQEDNEGRSPKTVRDIVVDTVPPAPPFVTQPRPGQSINNTNGQQVAGTAEPGTWVGVRGDPDDPTSEGPVLCTAPVDAQGHWDCQIPADSLPGEGNHRLTATTTDRAGHTSGPTKVPYVVDNTAPSTCAQSPRDPKCFGLDEPAEGATIPHQKPSFSGTGEPRAKITVKEGPVTLCEATVEDGATWRCEAKTALADGPHLVVGQAQDRTGNRSLPVTRAFEIDSVVPPVCQETDAALCGDSPALRIDRPIEGQTVTTPHVVFEGHGLAGAVVSVREGAQVLCTAEVLLDGSWSCTSTALSDRAYLVHATQANRAGLVSDPYARRLLVDTKAPVTCQAEPAAPYCFDISRPVLGAYLNDNTPLFEGTGEPGGHVVVRLLGPGGADGRALCDATVSAAGQWSCESTVVLPDGGHHVAGREADAAGNVSDRVEREFVVDTVAPPVCPSSNLGPCSDPDALSIDRPTEGQRINRPQPEFAGWGEAGATVQVKAGDNLLCTADVQIDHTWTCVSVVPWPDGRLTVTARQTDRAGNVSDPYDRAFIIDTTIDDPQVTRPAPHEPINNEAGMTVAGTAEPGSQVVVQDQASGGPLCVAVADPAGQWSCEVAPDKRPGDGHHTLAVTAEDSAGNVSGAVEVPYVVDNERPAVQITSPADGAQVQADHPDNQLVVSGRGETAGDRILVSDGRGNTCGTLVQGDLAWSCGFEQRLPEGAITLEATATDRAGNEGSDRRRLIVDRTPPPPPRVDEPAHQAWVNTGTPTVTGRGDPGDVIRVVNGDGRVVCDCVVDLDGTWSCTVGERLPDGPHKLVVTETDPAGNVSDAVDVEFTVDTVAPTPPTVDTSDPGVVWGHTDPDTAVEVQTEDGQTVCATTSNESGRYSCRPARPIAPGDAIWVTATDLAGNRSSVLVRVLEVAKPLPATGSSIGTGFLGVAGLLLLWGAAFLLGARRRGANEEPVGRYAA
jgi:hypothetical protein